MYKITLIVSCLFFLNLYLKAQDNIDNNTIIHEVDSLLRYVEDIKSDRFILYYPNGSIKCGVLLWEKENTKKGIAFEKTNKNKFLVKQINNKHIIQSFLFNQFEDSFEIFKQYVSPQPYVISHDFNTLWIYGDCIKKDTVVRPISEIIGGSDRFGRSAFLKFEKLFDLSKPSNSSPRRQKLQK